MDVDKVVCGDRKIHTCCIEDIFAVFMMHSTLTFQTRQI
ncbi:hypothetical protein NP493_74g05036 [Ridgeia piscesae]|uniref:Uncharacterized protein n=1 Tax=Ridgeia piscesae TaxID=27915 RepID=A0AAD9P9S7_RIDPI|nr:hypothetical protein NP493_74g05036 [Ridgeia piscesae]